MSAASMALTICGKCSFAAAGAQPATTRDSSVSGIGVSAVHAQKVRDGAARPPLSVHPVAARLGVRDGTGGAGVAFDRLDRLRIDVAHEHPDVVELKADQVAALRAVDSMHVGLASQLADRCPDAVHPGRAGIAIAVGDEVTAPRLGS